MQNLPLILTPTKPSQEFNATGNGFWYESTSAATGDTRLYVRSNRGDEVLLRPGQSFRSTDDVSVWSVRSYDAAASITGNIIIGSGEFQDNNSTIATGSMTVTNFPATQPVSGTINIGTMPNVEILNDVGNPIPVNGTVNIGTMPNVEILNDVGNPIPVSGTISIGNTPTVNIGTIPEVEVKNDTGNPLVTKDTFVAMTGAHFGGSTGGTCLGAASSSAIVTAGANANGVIIHAACLDSGSSALSLLTKATAPTSVTDGTVILYAKPSASTVDLRTPLRIPAGVGLFLYSAGGQDVGQLSRVLVTVL